MTTEARRARPTVAIVSFSPIERDARVLRQIEFLSARYDLIVVGYGGPPPRWSGHAGVAWVELDNAARRSRLLRAPLLLGSQLVAPLFDAWYWTSAPRRQALAALLASVRPIDAIHANDWDALPLAVRVARTTGARVVADLHEYAPLELPESRRWRWLFQRPIRRVLRRSSGSVDAWITVAPALASRYRAEFGFYPLVVLNAPDAIETPDHDVEGQALRLVHHGAAQPGRRLDLTIDAIGRAGSRFTLDLMLVGNPELVAELRAQANRVAPGRVTFLEPVPPSEIVERISRYDLGIFLLPATSFSKAEALPNKLFDFIAAGLGIVVGPAPGMANFVREHGIGIATSTLDPDAVAATLERLTAASVVAMRRAARQAAKTINATTEMTKMLALYERLMESS